MFDLWKKLPCPKSLCLFFARLLWQLEWKSMRELLLGSLLIAVIVFLFSRYSAGIFDFTLQRERLLCGTIMSFVSAIVCISACDRICFTFCEMMDDCPVLSIVHECGYYIHCVIHANIGARIVFRKASKGRRHFLLATWKCIKPYTCSKSKQRCHLLCYCTKRT